MRVNREVLSHFSLLLTERLSEINLRLDGKNIPTHAEKQLSQSWQMCRYLWWSSQWSCRSSWAAGRPTSPWKHGNYNTKPAAGPSLSEETEEKPWGEEKSDSHVLKALLTWPDEDTFRTSSEFPVFSLNHSCCRKAAKPAQTNEAAWIKPSPELSTELTTFNTQSVMSRQVKVHRCTAAHLYYIFSVTDHSMKTLSCFSFMDSLRLLQHIYLTALVLFIFINQHKRKL